MSNIEQLQKYIKKSNIKKHIVDFLIEHDELAVVVKKDHIVEILDFLKNDSECQFHLLMDLCGVDYLGNEHRFEVVYNLLSLTHNHRIRIKVRLSEGETVDSVYKLFKCADWYEREAFDMYGITFNNCKDDRRILTDYDFEGHPLRKDFPLTGHVEVKYDEEKKKVVYNPVELTQDFRNFDFTMPWKGSDYVLPGDEKANKK